MTTPVIDLAPVRDQFLALVAAVPNGGATVTGAERAFVDACDTIERYASLLVFERSRQERRAREKAEATQAQAAERQRKIDERKALHARARGAK